MKKIYLLALSAIFGASAMAQVSVTFQVDMNGQTVSPNGVHVAGAWQLEAGFPDDWQPGTAEMTDDNLDGIYSLTVDVPPGTYGFKYVNGNAWGSDENVPAIARIGNDRGFAVTGWHADNGGLTLPAVIYAGAAPEGMIPVRLVTNVSQVTEVSPLGVHVAGDLITPTWEPEYGTAMMINPDEYAYITYVDEPGTYEYKFFNGDFWGTDEWNGFGQDELPFCANGDLNRTLEVVAGGVSTPAYCFEACETCAEPNVILTVDMSNETVTNGEVFAAGSFNGFSDELMTDNGDGTYTIELLLLPGIYQFKFKNGSGGWENVPSSCQGDGTDNRDFTVVEDEIFSLTRCFEQCVEDCIPYPDPSDITFRVNMEDVAAISPDGVWVMGSFTEPDWQGGATQMTDLDADGIYEATFEGVSGSADISYKFANGDPNVVASEENGNFAAGGCGVATDIGGFNRTLVRTGEAMVLDIVCYNACVNCNLVGLEEIGLGEVNLFPNPSNGVTYLDVQNPNGYTLIMSIVDITGKTVRENVVLNSTRNEINTKNLNAGIYFLNIVNEQNERSVYKLMVR
ncbi:T9SS type A sorting domain-containing protein [Cryomorpha ignava]|uniref:T9SS type A sorting domain-containing protein n=1 Tax=Cryomorpha ignava TaxID=101383 RepID=A0A7K3WLM0_9FLAO|nr:T9SS type A sorting domain-containing protein [Cryomorpha ignava]NEN22539.1 T9SS type A sorting domain-containing protein [Cryomorpha ignava]